MNLEQTILKKLILHYVGSKNNLDPVLLSAEPLPPGEGIFSALRDSFLNRFRQAPEAYSFHHPSSLHFNEVYQYARGVFDGGDFAEASRAVARHLYEQSTHPKVKGGELYMAFFENLPLKGHLHRAIGLFKTENKSLFLDVEKKDRQLNLAMKEGVELTRIDKGCLIVDHRAEEGFDVHIFDNQNRGEEAQYWKEKFLGLRPQQNEFHHTSHFLTLTRQFITAAPDSGPELPRTEQVELLHRSIDYFKSNETFEVDQFQKEVFQSEEMIESFRRFGSRYVEQHDYDLAASFDISSDAVKKQSRVYKSVLKLDRNFHIYIHGRTDLIERGTEADGRKYYKIYYQDEA